MMRIFGSESDGYNLDRNYIIPNLFPQRSVLLTTQLDQMFLCVWEAGIYNPLSLLFIHN